MTAYIDPGVKQGAVVLGDGTVHNISKGDVFTFLDRFPIKEIWIEKQWARPHDGPSNAFNNGVMYGSLFMYCRLKGIAVNTITPQKWQKPLSVSGDKKSDRKRFLRDKAKELFPNSKVTLENCDAFLIMNYVKGL